MTFKETILAAAVLVLLIASCSHGIETTPTPGVESGSTQKIEFTSKVSPDNNQLEIRYCVEETVRTLDSFIRIQRYMSLHEICELVGQPDQDAGSGINNFLYYLDDGTVVKIGLTSQSGVLYVYHYVKDDQGAWKTLEILAADY